MALLDKKTLELSPELLLDVSPDVEYVQFRMGDKTTRVRKVDLWAACFAIADEKTQEQMMPVRQTEVQEFTRLIRIKLKKDMRKGEVLQTTFRMSVPVAVVEGLKGIIEPKQKKSQFLL